MCSPLEFQLLSTHYGVPASKLALAPFFAPPSPHAPPAAAPCFDDRKHFLMIGNWRHPPNLDSARWACSEVWPALRAALPPEHRDAELHLYGAYAAGAAQQLHKPVSGRLVWLSCAGRISQRSDGHACGARADCTCMQPLVSDCSLPLHQIAGSRGAHEGVGAQPRPYASVPRAAGPAEVWRRPQGQGERWMAELTLLLVHLAEG